MQRLTKTLVQTLAASAATVTIASAPAFAGQALGTPLGGSLPIAGGGLIGLVAAGVAAGIWIARRKD